MYGLYRCAACVPSVKVGDIAWNLQHILSLAESAGNAGCAAAVFPELSLTSATCGDLFRQPVLLKNAEKAVETFMEATREYSTLFVLGTPVQSGAKLYNCALFFNRGKLCGIVPKTCRMPDSPFSPAETATKNELFYAGCNVPFGSDLLFSCGDELLIGAEIGTDTDSPCPAGTLQALSGANLIVTLSAEKEFADRARKRLARLQEASARTFSARLFVSAGVSESTTDGVCSGHCAAVSLGKLQMNSPRFERGDKIYFTDLDIADVNGARISDKQYSLLTESVSIPEFRMIPLDPLPGSDGALLKRNRLPFVPEKKEILAERCAEIFAIQSSGLAKRMEHTGAKKLVIGISGGLDSTLALLVCLNTMKLLKRPASDIITVTMPGFGTTDRTYDNAIGLCRALGTELREIRIKDACLQHFRDIGHDPENRNVVYENTQARERTQILHDIANGVSGLCIGTGDLSEAAMGWCTFNGDHIAMYSVNGGVPKTLIRAIITWAGKDLPESVRTILNDVMNTPVSPELLPASDSGEIKQKTEDIIGPYEIHDFFLYHFFKFGSAPEKLLFLAENVFGDEYPREKLKQFLGVFLRRFFSQQFKRNCCQDGPKIGSISFSPRSDWKMPSDAAAAEWMNSLEN